MLPILFTVTAALYASVGLGGGSTYIALMVLIEMSVQDVPITALLCNLCVVSINLLRYKGTPFPYRVLIPLLCTSIPMAYLGGRTTVAPEVFQLILGSVLIMSGIAMGRREVEQSTTTTMTTAHCLIIGSILGGLAGLVGIGGGIFLIPILHFYNIGSPAQIGRIASGFIWFNSMAGLMGQHSKLTVFGTSDDVWSLLVAVIFGALLGTQLHLRVLSAKHLKRVSMILIIGVGCRLLWQSCIHISKI